MDNETNVYSVEYESHGLLFAMQILGTKAEVDTHADNLGCYEPELVDCNVPLMAEFRS